MKWLVLFVNFIKGYNKDTPLGRTSFISSIRKREMLKSASGMYDVNGSSYKKTVNN